MPDIKPDVLQSIREILNIGKDLRELRQRERQLEHSRAEHRENVLKHYDGSVRFVTPYGNVIIRTRESPVKFSLEDVRDILQSTEGVSDDVIAKFQTRFDEEADIHTKTTRTLTVQRHRQQTAKARKKRTHKSQTLKHNVKTT